MIYLASNKVLIIVYDFPPFIGGGGVMRTVKYTRYLREYGWEPVILTVGRRDYYMPDEDLSRELEGITVYRSKDFMRYIRYKDQPTQFTGPAEMSQRPLKARIKKYLKKTFIKDIKKGLNFLRDEFLFLPDESFAWALTALPKALSIINKEQIDVIYSTSPPHTPHVIAGIAAFMTSKPHVMDFRDGWSDNPIFNGKTPFRRGINRYLEKKTVLKAAAVITTTKSLSENIAEKYSLDHKVTTIFNGYDENSFTGINTAVEPDFLTFSYVGGIGRSRPLGFLLKALEGATLPKDKVRFNFVGFVDEDETEKVFLSPLKSVFSISGPVSHHRALGYMTASDILMVILYPEEDGLKVIPGKVFEYIRAGRPILALAPPEGELGKMIVKYRLGFVVPPRDITKIKETLEKIYTLWRDGQLDTCVSDKIRFGFDRRRLTGDLARVFDKVNG